MRVPFLLSSMIIGGMIGGGLVTFILHSNRITMLHERIEILEKKADFFQRIWDNVPEEYRKEVQP